MLGLTGFLDHTHTILENEFQQICNSDNNQIGGRCLYEKNDSFAFGLANQKLTSINLNGDCDAFINSNCGYFGISLNGAIYNFIELRETLIKYGVIFKTLSDSEVLIECYKKWGHQAFEKIDGSYTFALVDRKQNQLLIARDSFGTKPLFSYLEKGFFAFASEIKTLLRFSKINKEINKDALYSYFRNGYFTGIETIYKNIVQVKKGSLTIIDLFSGNQYSKPLTQKLLIKTEPTSELNSTIISHTEELLTDSILKRNITDVPTGILLSGGYDSATLAAILQKNINKRIKTYTLGFENRHFDEAPKAQKIADLLKTTHHEFYFTDSMACQALEKINDLFDQPQGESGTIASMHIAEQVSGDIKVLLGADGADVIFGGYHAYYQALNNPSDAGPTSFWAKIFKPFSNKSLSEIQKNGGYENLLDKYIDLTSCFSVDEIQRILGVTSTKPALKSSEEEGLGTLVTYDYENYLPNNLLQKSYTCSRYFGIDCRDPFLQADLIRYLTKLDRSWFINQKKTKYLLRQITHKYIPESLLDDKKRGFNIPLINWLKTCFRPYVEHYLNVEQLQKHQLLNIPEVISIKNSFYKKSTIQNAKKVWLLLQFQMWYESRISN